MEDKKSQKAPTIDSVIGTGPDIIQPPKTEITIAAKLNTSNPTKPTKHDAENDVTSSVKDPEFTVAVAAENKSSDGTAEGLVKENKSSDATVLISVEEKKSSDGSVEGSVEDNKSSDATVLCRLKKRSHQMVQPKGQSKKTSHRILQTTTMVQFHNARYPSRPQSIR
jgi:hypothetical protein